MKKLLALLVVFAMVAALAACSGAGEKATGTQAADAPKSGGSEAKVKTVGISMPTKSSERWVIDGNSMVKEFEALGYKADLQFGEDIIDNQIAQLENMITKGVDALVIAPIDGSAIGKIMQAAKDKNIPVIAYDRSILATPTCAYYATFDNFKVGVLQATDIEKRLGLKEGKGPYNIELFGGSPDDTNAFFFFDGAMSVLKPYIDNGQLVVRSGQMDMKVCSTLRWDGGVAQARMDNLLSKYYTTEKVDAVLSPYDGLSRGIISSLKAVGYGTGDQKMPIVTGQDAEVASVKSIIAGEQTSTVFKDTRILAKRAVKMVDAIFKGEKPEVNDEKTYKSSDGTIIPTYQEEPVAVDITNYKEVLIDSGYITEDQLK
ncbi:MAG: multiple monosaccharide ABC transporter substrate-binding protein [Bacillota bacterium]